MANGKLTAYHLHNRHLVICPWCDCRPCVPDCAYQTIPDARRAVPSRRQDSLSRDRGVAAPPVVLVWSQRRHSQA